MGGISPSGKTIIDDGQITNRKISNRAEDIIDCGKVQPFVAPSTNFGLAIAGTPSTKEEAVYTAEGAETILGFHVQMTSGASTDITFDLKKNNTTILTGTVGYTTAGTRTVKDGVLSSASLVAGDQLSILMTVNTATGATAPRAWINIRKAAVPE